MIIWQQLTVQIMNNMRFKMLMVCIFSVTVSARAQLRFQNLQQLWTYAEQHSVRVQATRVSALQARIGVNEAYGALLPGITANGAFTDNMTIQPTLIPASLFNPSAPPDTYTEAVFGRRYIYNASLVAQMGIIDIQDWFAIKTARLNQEIAALSIANATAGVYTELANAWYSYLLLTEAERLWIANADIASISADMACNLFKERQISEVTVNLASANQLKAEKNLELARANKRLQLNSLRLLLNTTDSIQIEETFEVPDVVAAGDPFSADPALLLAERQQALAKSKWQSAKAAYAPVLSAVYQYNTQLAGDQFLTFNNTNSLPQQYWGLRLSIPIFAGNSKRYQVQKAKMSLDQSGREWEQARIQSALNDSTLLIAYYSSRNAFTRSKDILALYKSNDTHAARKFIEGVISLDERLRVYSDLLSSQNEYLQNLSDYMVNQYRLKIRQINFLK